MLGSLIIMLIMGALIGLNIVVLGDEQSPCKWETKLDHKLLITACGISGTGIESKCYPDYPYWYCCTEKEIECFEPGL